MKKYKWIFLFSLFILVLSACGPCDLNEGDTLFLNTDMSFYGEGYSVIEEFGDVDDYLNLSQGTAVEIAKVRLGSSGGSAPTYHCEGYILSYWFDGKEYTNGVNKNLND